MAITSVEPSSRRWQAFSSCHRLRDAYIHASAASRTLVVTIDDFRTAKVDARDLLHLDDARGLIRKNDHAAHPLDAVNRAPHPDPHRGT